MATLILSTVGTLVGGPIGGAIGAFIGQQVDGRLFAPKGRKGPRLNELAVQTSAYGSAIPKLFGANRVAGTVIWATDLKESRRKVSNGKGQPKSTAYSYSASFAVALSARPIVGIGRIWADGNLLRGAAGDFKSETGFRIHNGSEHQDIDPLIASAEGADRTPAYRGLAYVVFEDFQLADFGNRIPTLSFEVFADNGDVSIGTILSELGGPGVECDHPALLGGFAATGDSVRAVAATLSELFPLIVRDDGAVVHLAAQPGAFPSPALRDLGGDAEGRPQPRLARERRPEASLPGVLTVAHYEPARDYQQGLQRVRDANRSRRDVRIDMPVTLDAARIKGHAMAALNRLNTERTTATVRLPWRYLGLAPGHRLSIPGDPGDWRVMSVALDRMVIVAELARQAVQSASALASDPGRNVGQPDLAHGPTILNLLDLPLLDEGIVSAPRVAVAAAGSQPGWRSAALLVSLDNGVSWQEAGPTAAAATMGTTVHALGAAGAHIFDESSTLEISLLHEGMSLQTTNDVAMLAGANVAFVGSELIQFREATPLGGARYRLSGLLRGRRGTEWAVPTHEAKEPFVLVERDALAFVDVSAGTALVRVVAAGRADPVPPEAVLERPGRALAPPAPAHLSAHRNANGDTQLVWLRRSRNGWLWLDGVDAPLVEESERYRIELKPDSGASRTVETAMASLVYSADDRALDLAAGATRLAVVVCQVGSFGLSRPAQLDFQIS